MKMNGITMFTRYSELGASSRHRFYNYLPGLRELGWEANVSPFFDDAYLRRLYSGRRPAPSFLVDAYRRRLVALASAGEKLLIEYELLPFFPWQVERQFLRKRRYILNFDDNVWEKYARLPLLRGKFNALTASASGIIAANRFLEEKVTRLNRNVICIPTALNPDPYRRGDAKFDKFTLVWIGTPMTYPYLEQLAPVWRELATQIDYELLVIAGPGLAERVMPGVPMRLVDWSSQTEVELLGRAHVGVMPLPDDNFARGKSAFKLLQYFAAGIPAVASPIGENRQVIVENGNGFLADTAAEWSERIVRLYHDADLRNRLASGAAASAEQYSLRTWVPRLADFMEKVWR